MGRRKGTIVVRGEEDGTVVADVVVREGELEVADIEVQADENSTDGGVNGATVGY